jgi:hypothetical protein
VGTWAVCSTIDKIVRHLSYGVSYCLGSGVPSETHLRVPETEVRGDFVSRFPFFIHVKAVDIDRKFQVVGCVKTCCTDYDIDWVLNAVRVNKARFCDAAYLLRICCCLGAN